MAQDAPIFHFNDARADVVGEVVARVMARTDQPLAVLSDAIYNEVKRLSADGSHEGELARWRALARKLPTMSETERRDEVRALAEHHAWDVAGNFNRRVYALASRMVPTLLGALVAPRATVLSRHIFDARALSARVQVQGSTDHVRGLLARGTVVYVPTHLSNLDSPVFGYALEQARLPPATYGAGKNLFTNPVLSFFMHNLGAYRVDRRLRHALYKDVLKTYSTVLLERGYHSLFFPGGTRSRSGGVERRLKLGLAGTGVEAYARTASRGPSVERRVYFVPTTISYLATLEAETLITDFLQEAGKARYIIEDDESSRLAKVAAFTEKLLRNDAGVVVRFAEPLDPFGNKVDPAGDSIDGCGRAFDPVGYLRDRKGEIVSDAERDAQYTRELGEAICDAFSRHTVVLATHLVAGVMMNRLRKGAGTDDLFSLLQVRQRVVVARTEVLAEVGAMRDRLVDLELQGRVVVGASCRRGTPEEVLDEALRAWRGAHTTPVVEENEGMLSIGSPSLIFYYQNRLATYGLVLDVLAPGRVPPRGRGDA